MQFTRNVASEEKWNITETGFGADESYYKGMLSSSAIKCKDGSKKFNKSQFNDDFCDCPDGSDEPGILLIVSISSPALNVFMNYDDEL